MLKELGEYKNNLRSIFANDDKICRLLLGENFESMDFNFDNEFDKYVVQHLFIANTIMDTKSYIMFESYVSSTYGSTKTMKVIIQTICHKDIVKYDEKPDGYPGLRYDVLAQYIEELLCPPDKQKRNDIIKKFGIGSFELMGVDIFQTEKYIGRILTFTVPDFR